MECDQQEKEERIKCVRENRSDDRLHVGNVSLQCAKETLEKSVSEVTKVKDSDVNCEEFIKHKHGEKWDVIDIDARKVFASWTPSLIKCIAVINHYGEKIKSMHESKISEVCPSCGEIED